MNNFIYLLLLKFNKCDPKKLFTFSSGHVGNYYLDDSCIYKIIVNNNPKEYAILLLRLMIEAFKIIVYILLPYKQIALLLRTILRKRFSQKVFFKEFIIVSTGVGVKEKYFGGIENLSERYELVRISSGLTFNANHIKYVEQFLNYRDIIRIIFSYLYLFKYALTRREGLSAKERLLFLYFSLREISENITYRNLILNLSLFRLSNHPNINKVIYPFEGRNWESVMTKSLNIAKKYSLGYVHSAITPRNLILYQGGFLGDDEIPCKIVTYSEIASEIIKKSLNVKKLTTGYFIADSSGPARENQKLDDIVVIALNGSNKEARVIIDIVSSISSKYKNKIFIRPNPNDKSFESIKKYLKKKNVNLYRVIPGYLPMICIYRSSTVALEYALLGVNIIYLEMDEIISANIFEAIPKIKVEKINIKNLMEEIILKTENCFSPVSVMGLADYKYMINIAKNNNDLLNLFK